MFDAPALPDDRPPPDPALGENPVWHPLLRCWRKRRRGERVRTKRVFDEGGGGPLHLARGVVAARAEALLLNEPFLKELEDLFGIEENDGFAVVAEVLAALCPAEYDEPTGDRKRVAAEASAVRQERGERPHADPPRPLRAEQPAGDIVARADQLGEQLRVKMLRQIEERRRVQAEPVSQSGGHIGAVEMPLEPVGQFLAEGGDHGREVVWGL